MTVLLAGLDLDARRGSSRSSCSDALGGREQFASAVASLVGAPGSNPARNEDAVGYLRITVTSPDRERVGKRFSAAVVETLLSSVPGIAGTSPPGDATMFAAYWPTLVDSRHLRHRVTVGGETLRGRRGGAGGEADRGHCDAALPSPAAHVGASLAGVETVRVPLGRLFGARSGDKGGNANLGVWARTPDAHAFLRAYLTAARLQEILPTAPLPRRGPPAPPTCAP